MKGDLGRQIVASEDRVVDRVVELVVDRVVDRVVDPVVDRVVDPVVDRVMERISGRIDASEQRLEELMRRLDFELETKLISEFWKWGRSSEMRTRDAVNVATEASSRVQLFSERLLNVEERVSALEQKRA